MKKEKANTRSSTLVDTSDEEGEANNDKSPMKMSGLKEIYTEVLKLPQPGTKQQTPIEIAKLWMDQGPDRQALFTMTPQQCAIECSKRHHWNEMEKRQSDLNLLSALNDLSDHQICQWKDYHSLLSFKKWMNQKREEGKEYIDGFMKQNTVNMKRYLERDDDDELYSVDSLVDFFIEAQLQTALDIVCSHLQMFSLYELERKFGDNREILETLVQSIEQTLSRRYVHMQEFLI